LASWFHQTRYTSFQRQLNIYEFERITDGPDKNAYHSPSFLRGRYELTFRMKRNVLKGTGTRGPSSPQTEPDFYSMPYQFENSSSGTPLAAQPPALVSPIFPLLNQEAAVASFNQNNTENRFGGINAACASRFDAGMKFPYTVNCSTGIPMTSGSFQNHHPTLSTLRLAQAFVPIDNQRYIPSLHDESFGGIGTSVWGASIRDPTIVLAEIRRPLMLDEYSGSNNVSALAAIIREEEMIDAINRRIVTSSYLDYVDLLMLGGGSAF
jgi:HSF-type DNA-binding